MRPFDCSLQDNIRDDMHDTAGRTPLHWAAFLGNVDAVRSALEEGTSDVNAKDRYGTTPLHLAAYTGHSDSVKLLVQHNAAINVQDCQGYTPLHLALFHACVDLTEFRARQTALIDAAYLRQQRTHQHTPTRADSTLALSHHPFTCAYALIQKVSSWFDLWLGFLLRNVPDTHFPIVQYLLQHGADLAPEDSAHLHHQFSTFNEQKERHAIMTALEEASRHTGLVPDLNRLILFFAERGIDSVQSRSTMQTENDSS